MSSGFVGKSMEKAFFYGGQINIIGGQNAILTSFLTIFGDFYPFICPPRYLLRRKSWDCSHICV